MPKQKRPKMGVVDFFSGCGGTSAGLQSAGMEILAGLDKDPDAGRTFALNFPRAKFLEVDIAGLRSRELSTALGGQVQCPILFAACVPCQPFSKQNKSPVRRVTRGHSAALLDEFHRFVRYFRPEYIFIENVPGLQKISTRTGPFSRFLCVLDRLGYYFDYGVVSSQAYGVPQRRQRLVLLASRLGPIAIPTATHGPGTPNPQYSTVWDWIGDLPAISAGENDPEVLNHRAAALSKMNLTRIKLTPEGGDRRDWPKRLLLPCHRRYDGHSDVYGRLSRDRPASALTTRCISLSNGRFGHPIQDRALSVREAACLQTFSRDFEFVGSLNSMARQIGNAVPVALAKHFGEAVVHHFRSHCSPRVA